ncbi:MAG: hypothetical protein V2A78_13665 [bacterium]
MASKKRYKVFRSSPKQLLIHSIIPFIVSVVLMNVGRHYAQVFAKDQVKQILLGYLPFVLGILVVFWIVIAFFQNISREVVITPLTITLKHGRNEKTVAWDGIIFEMPRDGRKRFKKVSVGNGKHKICIEEFYFPDFEVIVEVIKAAKESRTSTFTV